MTQTGTVNVDFTSPASKQATNTGLLNAFKPTAPACLDILFSRPFSTVPVVLLSITGLDANAGQRTNFVVEPVDINKAAFKIELTPLAMNTINGAIISWLATDA